MAVGSEPLYGTICSHAMASSLSPKMAPTFSACVLSNAIWPKQADVTHSLDNSKESATLFQLILLSTLLDIIRSVTWSLLVIIVYLYDSLVYRRVAPYRLLDEPAYYFFLE